MRKGQGAPWRSRDESGPETGDNAGIRIEADSETMTEARPEVSTGASTNAGTKAEAAVNMETKTRAKTEAGTDTNANSRTGSTVSASSEVTTEAKTDARNGVSTGPSTEAMTGTSTQAYAEGTTETNTQAHTEGTTETNTQARAKGRTETSTSGRTDPYMNANIGSSREASTKAEPYLRHRARGSSSPFWWQKQRQHHKKLFDEVQKQQQQQQHQHKQKQMRQLQQQQLQQQQLQQQQEDGEEHQGGSWHSDKVQSKGSHCAGPPGRARELVRPGSSDDAAPILDAAKGPLAWVLKRESTESSYPPLGSLHSSGSLSTTEEGPQREDASRTPATPNLSPSLYVSFASLGTPQPCHSDGASHKSQVPENHLGACHESQESPDGTSHKSEQAHTGSSHKSHEACCDEDSHRSQEEFSSGISPSSTLSDGTQDWETELALLRQVLGRPALGSGKGCTAGAPQGGAVVVGADVAHGEDDVASSSDEEFEAFVASCVSRRTVFGGGGCFVPKGASKRTPLPQSNRANPPGTKPLRQNAPPRSTHGRKAPGKDPGRNGRGKQDPAKSSNLSDPLKLGLEKETAGSSAMEAFLLAATKERRVEQYVKSVERVRSRERRVQHAGMGG